MIEELRKKYADKKFIDVVFSEDEDDESIECGTTVINLDDFLSLGDVFFCQEEVISGDDTAKDMADSALAEALSRVADDLDITLSAEGDIYELDDDDRSKILRKVYKEYYDENFERVLSKCTGNDETLTIMKNPVYDVYYCDRSGAEAELPNLSPLIDELYAELKKAAEDELAKHEKMLEDVSTFINSHKKAYGAATTQTARNKIVQEIKLILNRDYRAVAAGFTKDIIHGILSGTY